MSEQSESEIGRLDLLKIPLFFIAVMLDSIFRQIPKSIWHHVRCEKMGRDWEWTTETRDVWGEPMDYELCSECGMYRPHPGGV